MVNVRVVLFRLASGGKEIWIRPDHVEFIMESSQGSTTMGLGGEIYEVLGDYLDTATALGFELSSSPVTPTTMDQVVE